MKIRTLSLLQTALDDEFAWRLKEIADLKVAVRQSNGLGARTLIRAGVALLYAHWEGFVKASATIYIDFVNNQGMRNADLQTCFAVLGVKKYLDDLGRAKKAHVLISALEFIQDTANDRAQLRVKSAVDTESNLKAEVFENIAISVGISTAQYESRYQFMNESLLARRNRIAHGEFVDLDSEGWRGIADEVLRLMRLVKTDIENAASTSAFVRPSAKPLNIATQAQK